MKEEIKWLDHEDLIENGWKKHFLKDETSTKNYSDLFYTKYGYQLRYGHWVTTNEKGGVTSTYKCMVTICTNNGETVFNGKCPTIKELNYIFDLIDQTK